MSIDAIEHDFRETVCSEIRLISEGIQRFRVFTPFLFDDGDALIIVLKREAGRWLLSDEGHTYMHLSYDLEERDLQRGTRQIIITTALSTFGVEDREGELILPVPGNRYGDSLFSFIQALLKITDVTYLSRERVRSTFLEDFRALISEIVPEGRRNFDWHHPERDHQGMYTVDCRINGMPKPLFVYALPNDDRTRDATIAILQFEMWSLSFHSLAIFEEQENINRKVLARFTDVCEKQFASLWLNKERITRFLRELTEGEMSDTRGISP